MCGEQEVATWREINRLREKNARWEQTIMQLNAELSRLRRDSEALSRVREVYNAFMIRGGMTYTTFIDRLKSAIADAGEES